MLPFHHLFSAWESILKRDGVFDSKQDWIQYQVSKDIVFHINNTDFFQFYARNKQIAIPPKGWAIQVFVDGKSLFGGILGVSTQHINGPDMQEILWALYIAKRGDMKFNSKKADAQIDEVLNARPELMEMTDPEIRAALGEPIQVQDVEEF